MATVREGLDQALARRDELGLTGQAAARRIAQGPGWSVSDVVCTSGPRDRVFEEQHAGFSIAIVVAGTFQYRSSCGRELMAPGSLLLGNPGQCFECGHEHGQGDRCVSFYFAPEYFETLAEDCGWRGGRPVFRALRLPAAREFAWLTAQACAGLTRPCDAAPDWEALGIRLAARAIRMHRDAPSDAGSSPPSAAARVTRALRSIEQQFDASLNLRTLAQRAGLSPYHFLRTFERLTGLTPHQYLLRWRLREAATRLTLLSSKIVDIALDSGFADVSNFNRAFRKEFGASPREYRSRAQVRTV
ncbi:MAG TPA: AraC family transcriptional regulator [Bryobacteraceae bacterium]|nr:AraC family transcriptional regulator [Bryobacteraceae bacterium]